MPVQQRCRLLTPGMLSLGLWLAPVLAGEPSPSPAPANAAAPKQLPAQMDLRPKLEEWGLKPRSQGGRPTCSVFTFASALEFAVANAQPPGERLSVEFLNWSANQTGHSVLLVGYRDEAGQPGGGVFIFRNTNRGGRDGYMPYAYAQAFMNDAVWIESKTPATSPPTDSR